MDSDTDSEREKSSDPNEGLLSSDDKTFHDDDEPAEDSSPADDEEEPEEEECLLPQKKAQIRCDQDQPPLVVLVQPSAEAIEVRQEIDDTNPVAVAAKASDMDGDSQLEVMEHQMETVTEPDPEPRSVQHPCAIVSASPLNASIPPRIFSSTDTCCPPLRWSEHRMWSLATLRSPRAMLRATSGRVRRRHPRAQPVVAFSPAFPDSPSLRRVATVPRVCAWN